MRHTCCCAYVNISRVYFLIYCTVTYFFKCAKWIQSLLPSYKIDISAFRVILLCWNGPWSQTGFVMCAFKNLLCNYDELLLSTPSIFSTVLLVLFVVLRDATFSQQMSESTLFNKEYLSISALKYTLLRCLKVVTLKRFSNQKVSEHNSHSSERNVSFDFCLNVV